MDARTANGMQGLLARSSTPLGFAWSVLNM